MIRGFDMSDGTGRQTMVAQSGTSDNPKSSNQESSKKPKTLGKYLLVSATQTIVEFGSFTLLHVLSVPSAIANGVAIVLSGTEGNYSATVTPNALATQ